MKISLGSKEYTFTFKDVIYILGLVGMGCGWFVTARITKIKNEMKDQVQDAKIEAQAIEIKELKFENKKRDTYVKENADNIVWIVRILELE